MKNRVLLSILLLPVWVNSAFADQPKVNDALKARLTEMVPTMAPDSIKSTPVDGVYEVAYGAQVVYFSEDGRYMLTGSLFDLDTRTDLTELTKNKARVDTIDKVSEKDMIVYEPSDGYQHTVTVFTDVDCPYCRKLHNEMSQYQDKGIKVRYMLFPRAPEGTPTFGKAVSVWCADDRNKALDDAKAGKEIEAKNCPNPVAEQVAIGQDLGVRGTPAILLEDGELIPGYQPAAQLAATLAAHEKDKPSETTASK